MAMRFFCPPRRDETLAARLRIAGCILRSGADVAGNRMWIAGRGRRSMVGSGCVTTPALATTDTEQSEGRREKLMGRKKTQLGLQAMASEEEAGYI
jgi:hypothetical protein